MRICLFSAPPNLIHGTTVDGIMERILCKSCRDYKELISTISSLPTLLASDSSVCLSMNMWVNNIIPSRYVRTERPWYMIYFFQIKLIIIDSIAFPFRYDFDFASISERCRILAELQQNLLRLAVVNKLAVIFIDNEWSRKPPNIISFIIFQSHRLL